MRVRSVETIVQAALDSYRNTGMNEVSLLSLSSSDYPHFEELVKRMHEVFAPLGVNVSLPSLRVNHQLRSVPQLHSRMRGLTESFERHWYGFASASPNDWQDFRAGYVAALQAATK